jgi:glycosyltransferase involved in cell wall biosynthesis
MATPDRTRLRVVTLIDTLGFGGAEVLAASAAAQLARHGHDSYLCASRTIPEGFAQQAAADGVRVLELGRRGTLDLRAWLPLVRLLRRERIDVLHAHKFGSNLWGSLVGRLACVPVVVAHEHSWANEAGTLRRLLDRFVIAPLADAIVAVSRADRELMVRVERIPPERVRVIPNGIPVPQPTGADVRAELGLGPDALVAVSVARLVPVKALDVLVEAAALLAPDLPRLRVVLVGDGPEEARLRALVAERGLEQVVLLTGPRGDVPDVLAAADVAVICSDTEGMPLAVIEYLAAGLPVVATNVGGLPELVEDGVDGLLVPARDSRALAEALGRVLRDEELRRRLGARARDRQRDEFDLAASVRRYEELYAELGAGHR